MLAGRKQFDDARHVPASLAERLVELRSKGKHACEIPAKLADASRQADAQVMGWCRTHGSKLGTLRGLRRTIAQSKICSYCDAAWSHELLRPMPLRCSCSKASGCSCQSHIARWYGGGPAGRRSKLQSQQCDGNMPASLSSIAVSLLLPAKLRSGLLAVQTVLWTPATTQLASNILKLGMCGPDWWQDSR